MKNLSIFEPQIEKHHAYKKHVVEYEWIEHAYILDFFKTEHLF